MNRFRVLTLLILVMVSATACGLLQEPEEASGPISAIPLATAAPSTVAPTEPVATADQAGSGVAAETVNETPTPAPTAAEVVEDAAPVNELTVFEISPAESSVRFELDEDLRGERITVVGRTDQVAGQIAVNFADLSATQVGTIQINARTLLTDNDFRNRAIQNEILDTGDYEFITFTPTAINDLPGEVVIGQEVTFSVSGELTIRDISRPATFEITATAVSENQLVGSAATTILRADYGLNIPSVRNVANVEEEVELYIDFVAYSVT